jgi:hypothetical protein
LTYAVLFFESFGSKPMNTRVTAMMFWAQSDDRRVVSFAAEASDVMDFARCCSESEV